MLLSPHFSLEELTVSQTAARRGIDNTPSPEVLINLARLADMLERVRGVCAAPIIISSGYRSPDLNAAVGGSPTSAHMLGLAVDFTCPTMGPPLWVAQTLSLAPQIPYDQLIHEFGVWVHLGLAEVGHVPRRQCLSIFSGTGYMVGLVKAPGPARMV